MEGSRQKAGSDSNSDLNVKLYGPAGRVKWPTRVRRPRQDERI